MKTMRLNMFTKNCLSPEAKATAGQALFSSALLPFYYYYSLFARCELLRLIEADSSKRPPVHSVSIKSPFLGPPCEPDSNADTRHEESPTFFKN